MSSSRDSDRESHHSDNASQSMPAAGEGIDAPPAQSETRDGATMLTIRTESSGRPLMPFDEQTETAEPNNEVADDAMDIDTDPAPRHEPSQHLRYRNEVVTHDDIREVLHQLRTMSDTRRATTNETPENTEAIIEDRGQGQTEPYDTGEDLTVGQPQTATPVGQSVTQPSTTRAAIELVEEAAADDSAETVDFDITKAADHKNLGHCHFTSFPSDALQDGCPVNVPDLEPVGGIYSAPKGWMADLDFNGGRASQPFIALNFKFAKRDRRNQPFDHSKPYDSARIQWIPGFVSSNNEWQIKSFVFSRMADFERGPFPHLQSIVDTMPALRTQDVIDKIVFQTMMMRITTTSAISTGGKYIETQLEGLPLDVAENIRRLFSGVVQSVYIWFHPKMAQNEPDIEDLLSPLATQIDQNMKSFHPYRDESGKVDLQAMLGVKVDEVGNGFLVTKDKDGNPSSLIQHPKCYWWNHHTDFAICFGMASVRQAQWMRKQTSHLEQGHQRMFLVKAIGQDIPLSGGVDLNKTYQQQYLGYIRMNSMPDERQAKAPPSGTRFRMQFVNTDTFAEHTPVPENEEWPGTVIDHEIGCTLTDTDFCILFVKPRSIDQGTFEFHTRPETLATVRLASVHLRAVHDNVSTMRELLGIAQLADPPQEQRDSLMPIRMALMTQPEDHARTVEDLALKDPFAWLRFSHFIQHVMNLNRYQLSVATALANVEDGFIVVDGPPGTGKTSTLCWLVIGALTQDHIILVVGPTNVAVDGLANKINAQLRSRENNNVTKDVKQGLEGKQLFRLEVAGAEIQAMLKISSYANLSLENLDEVRALDNDEAEDITAALAATFQTFDDLEIDEELEIQARIQKLQDVVSRKDARKTSVVPLRMTMAYHLYRQSLEDELKAYQDLDALKAVWQQPVATNAEIANRRALVQSGQLSEEFVTAAQQPPVTDEEFMEMVLQGQIKDVAQRNPSQKWRVLLFEFQKSKGRLSKAKRNAFMSSWRGMLERTLKSIDVVFTTCNNAGSDLLALGFHPQILLCDEAAQVSVPSLAIPLTQSGKLLATVLAGDIRQLGPWNMAKHYDEFSEFSEMSALSLLEKKDWRIHRLKMQYRMAPEIVQWPSYKFYGGRLETAPSTQADNDWRKMFRKMSMEQYGIRPTQGGSEYFHINVENSLSLVGRNSTSLANSAHAQVSAEVVDKLIRQGASAKDITILVYYVGQKTMTEIKLKTAAEQAPEGRQWVVNDIAVKTVDGFQGAENHFVILDIVVAHLGRKTALVQRPGPNVMDDNQDNGTEASGSPQSGPSAFVRDVGRLCCALTRAKDGLVVVSRASCLTILRAKGSKLTPSRSAIADMFLDAHERKLVFADDRSWKTAEEYSRVTGTWSLSRRYNLERNASTEAAESLHQAMRNFDQARLYTGKDDDIELPQYRCRGLITSQAPIDAPMRGNNELETSGQSSSSEERENSTGNMAGRKRKRSESTTSGQGEQDGEASE